MIKNATSQTENISIDTRQMSGKPMWQDQVLTTQDTLIDTMRQCIVKLNGKYNIIQSTGISKDEKVSSLNNNINPDLLETQLRIKKLQQTIADCLSPSTMHSESQTMVEDNTPKVLKTVYIGSEAIADEEDPDFHISKSKEVDENDEQSSEIDSSEEQEQDESRYFINSDIENDNEDDDVFQYNMQDDIDGLNESLLSSEDETVLYNEDDDSYHGSQNESNDEVESSVEDDIEIVHNHPVEHIDLSNDIYEPPSNLIEISDDDDDLIVENQTDLTQWKPISNNMVEIEPLLDDENFVARPTLFDTPEPIQMFQWTDELFGRLNNFFHIKNFRPNQLEAINSTLQGKDVFVLMPTGGGKSLCYQLPAIMKSGKTCGTTIVISPLISLMQDQVENLLSLNIKASMFSSKNSAEQRRVTFDLLLNGKLDLIYISPEMISSSKQCQKAIDTLFQRDMLSRIVIDEAHCVSSWGHDFRPDYKKLHIFKDKYPEIPMIALTATANEFVQNDIIKNLSLRNPSIYRQSFNRDNLYYQIIPKDKSTVSLMANFIKTMFNRQPGIIYCHSKSSCEKLTGLLQKEGIRCQFYHAGMKHEDRINVQTQWQNNQLQVIIATIAFGMGIDKPDVRFVFHYTVPRTLENYYQETGRAGRDGKYSYCITFYSLSDVRTLQKMIQRDKGLNKENKLRHFDKLKEVMQYCDDKINCRRKLVLSYFNEEFNSKDCHKNCDNCSKREMMQTTLETTGELQNNVEEEEKDITNVTKDILALVSSLQDEKVTASYCQDVFRGSKMSKIVQSGHDNLEQHGKGKEFNRADMEKIFFHLITLRILQEYSITNNMGFASNYVKMGPNAKNLRNPAYTILLKFYKEKRQRISNKNASPESSSQHTPKFGFISEYNRRQKEHIERPLTSEAYQKRNTESMYTSRYHVSEREFTENRDIIKEIKMNHLTSVSPEGTSRKRRGTKGKRVSKPYRKRRRRKYPSKSRSK